MAQILLPQLGESVTEGTISKWLKRVGDTVQKYEPIAEIMTDKVTAEIPSDQAGILAQILVEEGATVAVGTPIAIVTAAEEAVVGPGEALQGQKEAPSEKVGEAFAGGTAQQDERKHPRYSPAVRRLLQANKLDPTQITGSGLGGRLTRKDVLAFLEKREEEEKRQSDIAREESLIVPFSQGSTLAEKAAASDPVSPQDGDTLLPLTPLRRTIAQHMVEAKQQAPQAWTMVEVDVTPMVRLREKWKEEFKKREGISLTYLPFFLKAVAESLKEYPLLNSTWAENKIIIKNDINISIAVAGEDVVYVPVIHHADRLSLRGLAYAVHDLAARARAGKLTLADVTGGTFTVNNTGSFGSILSQPILNTPQAALLTMESIVKRPVIMADDSLAIRYMMNMCLTLDHRVLDGFISGKFLAAVKKRLEGIKEEDFI